MRAKVATVLSFDSARPSIDLDWNNWSVGTEVEQQELSVVLLTFGSAHRRKRRPISGACITPIDALSRTYKVGTLPLPSHWPTTYSMVRAQAARLSSTERLLPAFPFFSTLACPSLSLITTRNTPIHLCDYDSGYSRVQTPCLPYLIILNYIPRLHCNLFGLVVRNTLPALDSNFSSAWSSASTCTLFTTSDISSL